MKDCPEIKVVREKCLTMFDECIERALLIQPELDTLYSDFQEGKEEYALRSRYMPRGFYCPSPVLEYIIGNARRGRIAKRVTSATYPTHRYLFDSESKLRIAETYFPRTTHTEYIFHEGNRVYGYTYNWEKYITAVSIAEYKYGKIAWYFYADCNYYLPTINPNYGAYSMMYQVFSYEEGGYFDVSFYETHGAKNLPQRCLGHYRFRQKEDGNFEYCRTGNRFT